MNKSRMIEKKNLQQAEEFSSKMNSQKFVSKQKKIVCETLNDVIDVDLASSLFS
jgi:hypothetical protein